MGASNSKPQTVQMSNTIPFQISREVLERVERASNPKKDQAAPVACESCSRAAAGGAEPVSSTLDGNSTEQLPQVQPQSYQQQKAIAASWARRSTEIEETQFSKTLDRVHNLFGEPVKWAKAHECSADIDLMEQQLIACYRQYGSEPLNCASLAKQYHTFVFNKQVNTVKNTQSEAQDANEMPEDAN